MSTATLTREVSIKCAHCQGRHGSVAEVRACSLKPIVSVVTQRVPVTDAGMYMTYAGDVFLVQPSAQGNLYAKKLVATMHGDKVHKLEFAYEKGAIFTLDARMRMTVADVANLGKLTEHCWVCGKRLTVKKSIDAGIGPVCAKKV
jgi:hypothetical protein